MPHIAYFPSLNMRARCAISLWKLLAQQALEALDLNMAEKAFVLCGKNAFHGVRLVKRLSNISDRSANIVVETPLNPNDMYLHGTVQEWGNIRCNTTAVSAMSPVLSPSCPPLQPLG